MERSRRTIRVVAAGLACCALAACYPAPEYDVERLGVPRFVRTNYLDPASLSRISLFRSHDGHDYSDGVESCRSMKHYLKFPTASDVIRSPVTGVVRRTVDEWAGSQIHVVSADQPAFTFMLFHVTLAAPLPAGTRVEEGTILGTHVGTQTYSDVAVEVNTPSGRRLVSYFETLTDEAFAPFQARGLASRASLVITREQRDAAPLTCAGETFLNAAADPYPQDVAF